MTDDKIDDLARLIWIACQSENIVPDGRSWAGAPGSWVSDPEDQDCQRLVIVVPEEEKRAWRAVARRVVNA